MGRMHNYIKLVQWSINNSKYIFELTFLLQFENRLYLGCSSWKGNKETKERPFGEDVYKLVRR